MAISSSWWKKRAPASTPSCWTKPYTAADVIFLDRMLGQLEKKLKLERQIGIEVLIEEVQALQNVESIAACSPRMECLIFGMGDYAASHGIDTKDIGESDSYPGDIFHYPRFRITMAAPRRGAGRRGWTIREFQERGGIPRRSATRAGTWHGR